MFETPVKPPKRLDEEVTTFWKEEEEPDLFPDATEREKVEHNYGYS